MRTHPFPERRAEDKRFDMIFESDELFCIVETIVGSLSLPLTLKESGVKVVAAESAPNPPVRQLVT
jgi:hypothetical protein